MNLGSWHCNGKSRHYFHFLSGRLTLRVPRLLWAAWLDLMIWWEEK